MKRKKYNVLNESEDFLGRDFSEETLNQSNKEENNYELSIEFPVCCGTREVRLFVAQIPYESIFKRFAQTVNSLIGISASEIELQINLKYGPKTIEKTFTPDFKKLAISEFITTYADIQNLRNAGYSKIVVDPFFRFVVKFNAEPDITEKTILSDINAILKWYYAAESSLLVINKYKRSRIPTKFNFKDNSSDYTNDYDGDSEPLKKFFLYNMYMIITGREPYEEFSKIQNNTLSKLEHIRTSPYDKEFFHNFINLVLNDLNSKNDFKLSLKQITDSFGNSDSSHNLALVEITDTDENWNTVGNAIADTAEHYMSDENKYKFLEYGYNDTAYIYILVKLTEEQKQMFSGDRTVYRTIRFNIPDEPVTISIRLYVEYATDEYLNNNKIIYQRLIDKTHIVS